MASQSTVLYPNLLQSIASSTMTSSYQEIGIGLAKPARLVKIVNNSTQDVTVSWDGINDHDYVPAAGFTLYDVGTNRGNSASSMDIQQGQAFYVKGTAGTGNVYLVSLFAKTPGEQS